MVVQAIRLAHRPAAARQANRCGCSVQPRLWSDAL